ncbi:MAG: OmpA family protein [Marinilabiliaceae bacterium]|nr:OmpA family protein [Marinilabiliaceae bacterium]
MKYIIITIFVCVTTLMSAQKNRLTTKNKGAILLYEQAMNDFGKGNSGSAIANLNNAIVKDGKFIEAYLLLGDIYNNRQEYLKEMDILKKALIVDSTFFRTTYFNIGNAAFNAGLYTEAIHWYEISLTKFTDKRSLDKVNERLEKARYAVKMVGNTQEIELISVGDGINSEFDEYWPSLTADEQTMVFTVLLPRDIEMYERYDLQKKPYYFQEDFFVSHRSKDGIWQPREPLKGNINTTLNEGAQTLSADGNMMFFTACGREDSRGSCDIYFSYKTNFGWSTPKNIGQPVNTPYWESQPCFAADGKTLLWVSNRPGGFGVKDIWQATMQGFDPNGTPIFGDVKNLGEKINTAGEESSPFLHHDGQTLYFSSDGWDGMGGMDLFLSRKDDNGEWSEPINLGYPINTAGDEIGLVINARGNRAYFSTNNREGKNNGKDIYFFELPTDIRPNPTLYVKGRVFDAETGVNLPANFQLQDLSTGELVVTTQGSKFSGEFLVSLPLGGSYAFRAEHPGYMFYSGHFDIDKSHPLDQYYYLDIALNPIKAGAKMTLENIFYETNSFQLLEHSKIELDALVKFLKENMTITVMIGGHTDNIGTATYNQTLSEKRAESVYKYVVSQGIDSKRLLFKGFGLTQPVESNETEEGRAKNRRTEIVVL